MVTLASLLVLGACGNEEKDNKDNKKQNEVKKDEKKTTKEKSNKHNKAETSENTTLNEPNNNTTQNEVNNNNAANQYTNFDNITDRNTLKSIIYGNYNELDKIHAYNSAVANGVIPQGNVLEGPAIAAYESSLRVENGTEKSIYENESQKQDYENNGVYRTPEEQKAHEDWINDQIEWENTSEQEKEKIRKADAEKYGYEYDPNDYLD